MESVMQVNERQLTLKSIISSQRHMRSVNIINILREINQLNWYEQIRKLNIEVLEYPLE